MFGCGAFANLGCVGGTFSVLQSRA